MGYLIAMLAAGLLCWVVARHAGRGSRSPAIAATAAEAALPPPVGGLVPELRPFDAILEYRDADGALSKRTITVHRLNGRRATKSRGMGILDVQAFCHLRQAYRTFVLLRMQSLADPATGEVAPDPHAWLLEKAGMRAHAFPFELLEFTAVLAQPVRAVLTTPPGKTVPSRRWLAEIQSIEVDSGRAQAFSAELRRARPSDAPDDNPRQRKFYRLRPGPQSKLESLAIDGTQVPMKDPWRWLLEVARENMPKG